MSVGRDFEIAGIAAQRYAYDSAQWTAINLAEVANNAITVATPGRDVALVEIDNMTAAILAIRLKDPGIEDPAYTDGSILLAKLGNYTLEKVRGLQTIWLRCAPNFQGTVQVILHSYRDATRSPW
tara:strand:- start:3440 stop:3814 length:375 start_codon:yes stop_codon:yes gene_type:complete